MFGTSSDGGEAKVFLVHNRSFGVVFLGVGSEHAVVVDVDARVATASAPWVRLDLRIDSVTCVLGGTVIESQAP